jgi:hypothetical protein
MRRSGPNRPTAASSHGRGISGAGVRPHDAAHVESGGLALVVLEGVDVGQRVIVAEQVANERAVRQPEHRVPPLIRQMDVAVDHRAERRHGASIPVPEGAGLM